MHIVSRPLPAPALVSQSSVKVRGLPLPRPVGLSRSRCTRISCTQGFPDGIGSAAMELEVPEEYTEPMENEEEQEDEGEESSGGWTKDEIDAISALFARPMRQKPRNPAKQRALPLPLPHKTRPPTAPSPKQHVRLAARPALSSRAPFSDRVRKDPEFLVGLAREIAALPPDRDAAAALDPWARFLL